MFISSLLPGLLAVATIVSATPANNQRVHYVIIGAGPAGYVTAEKLTQNPRVMVTLLEAGPDGSTDPLITTPAKFFDTQEYMWPYNTQPEPNLGGLTPNLWQGRMLGGGSGVNGMLYCRGSASVFDEWAEISGNKGLAWRSLLEDFKKTAHYRSDPTDSDYAQVVDQQAFGDGPLEITRARKLVSFDEPFANALKNTLHLDEIDMISGTGIGVSLGLETIRASNRTRSYAVNAYGDRMAGRPNFRLIHDAWVQHIGFHRQTAQNVVYTNRRNQTLTIQADEVIVAAGAINSPQLLMLSGIGPKEKLAALKIPLVADIPEVGGNLYDHHYSVMQFQAAASVETAWQWSENATGAAIAQAQYTRHGGGPLGRNNGDVYGALRLPDAVFEAVNSSHYLQLPRGPTPCDL
ncbi:GMC family oxidoreductase [Aspergillus tanneri]|uniref:Glucose-methanol-choline oxidoreductase N-terminal domain-containing protein n=1 Tax=Aspergillus tanneri TaxID=1220188 RepID=A0A5M9MRS8_9EURO|nr:uncharacterized protein ATNIH1004_003967 [Aspergillus tanneri]KAA8648084.1 hypothetical protein ATNIH1004_003967 [Aspergillus tanneri]